MLRDCSALNPPLLSKQNVFNCLVWSYEKEYRPLYVISVCLGSTLLMQIILFFITLYTVLNLAATNFHETLNILYHIYPVICKIPPLSHRQCNGHSYDAIWVPWGHSGRIASMYSLYTDNSSVWLRSLDVENTGRKSHWSSRKQVHQKDDETSLDKTDDQRVDLRAGRGNRK